MIEQPNPQVKPVQKSIDKSGVTVIVNTGPDMDFIKKIVEMYMCKFKQKGGAESEGPQPTPSPLTTEPMGPIDNNTPTGATRAPNKSINDFSNF